MDQGARRLLAPVDRVGPFALPGLASAGGTSCRSEYVSVCTDEHGDAGGSGDGGHRLHRGADVEGVGDRSGEQGADGEAAVAP
jgi:hypothetical protein